MSELAALQKRIDQLESRHAIAELVTAYCLACDEQDMPRLMSLFTPDCKMRSKDPQFMQATGLAEIERMFERMFSIRGPAYHWTHDHTVSFDTADPNRATGMVLAHAETTPNGVASLAAIRYYDEYRRTGGTWKFQARTLHFLYYMPAKDYIETLPHPLRVRVHGDCRPADFPESLPHWKKAPQVA
jgi:ketosteroid isomerase-like protein